MEFDCRPIAVQKIDFSDATYRLSIEDRDHGGPINGDMHHIVSPPILLDNNGRFTIIRGFRQVQVHMGQPNATIQSIVMGPDTSAMDCAKIAVCSLVSCGSPNIVASSAAVVLLSSFCSSGKELTSVARQCGLSVNGAMVAKLLQVGQMPEAVRRGLSEGSIALPVAMILDGEPDDGLKVMLAELLRELDVSLNRQRELVEWIKAICKRDQMTIDQLLEETEIRNLRKDRQIDIRQKVSRVRSYLRRRRFPAITQFEQRYQSILRDLSLNPGMQLRPPAHFESDTYCLTMEFDGYDALLNQQKALEKLINKKNINMLWSMME